MRKQGFVFTLIVCLLSVGCNLRAGGSTVMLKNTAVSVYLSPNGGAEEAVVDAIRAARQSIFVQAYSFTSAPISGALKAAHDRGIRVQVILDKSQRTEHYSGMTYLQHAGVFVAVDAAHAIAHNKVMVIDGEIVITGSYNFSKAAEHSNAENLLVIRDYGLAKIYKDNWTHHLQHSER